MITTYLTVLVVALHQVMAQETNTTMKCNEEFLKYFDGKVKLHQYHTKELEHQCCKEEFKTYSTCCESESLKEQMERVVAASNLRWNNAIKKSYLFRKEILANKNAIIDKVKQFLPYINLQIKEKKMQSYVINAANFLLASLPLIDNKTLTEREIAYKKNAPACFATLSGYRQSSMCALCSGRVAQYYNGYILKVQNGACVATLESCYSTFQYMFTVMGTIRPLMDVMNSVDPSSNYPATIDALPYLSNI